MRSYRESGRERITKLYVEMRNKKFNLDQEQEKGAKMRINENSPTHLNHIQLKWSHSFIKRCAGQFHSERPGVHKLWEIEWERYLLLHTVFGFVCFVSSSNISCRLVIRIVYVKMESPLKYLVELKKWIILHWM